MPGRASPGRAPSLWPPVLIAAAALGSLGAALASGLWSASGVASNAAIAMLLVPLFVVTVVRVEPSLTLTGGLLLSVFSGNWGNIGAPVALDRVAIAAGVAGVAWRARTEPEYRPTGLAIYWLLAVVSAYAIASALAVGTLTDHDAFFALVDRLGLVSFVLFVVAPVAFRTDRQRAHLLAGLVGLGGYLGLTALFEGVGLDGIVLPRYIADASVGIHQERARGPFVEAAANGLALFGCGVACVIAAARWRDRWRWVAAGVGVLCALGILLTLTRQAWLGAVLGALAGLVTASRLRPYVVPLVAGGALLVIGAFAVIPGLQERAGERARDNRPVWDRLNSDRAAVDMVAARPLVGFGWGKFQDRASGYYRLSPDFPLTSVHTLHSVVLSNAVELGLVGTTLWLAALAMALAAGIFGRGPPELEPWKRGLLAMAVCWLVVSNFTPLGYSFSNYLLWTWAGLAAAGASRYRTNTSRSAATLRARS
jgi:O-antigen ligase